MSNLLSSYPQQQESQFKVLPLHLPTGQPIEYWAVSDIHGCVWQFERALELLGLHEGKRLLVLGDVLDRGLYSEDCMQLIMGCEWIDMCIGNHELSWKFIMVDELYDFFISDETWQYIQELGLGFYLPFGDTGEGEAVYLSHCYQPIEVIRDEVIIDLDCLDTIFESEEVWLKEHSGLGYKFVSGHVPTRSHPAWLKKSRVQGEVLRFGDRIMIDGGTPTTGILPLYNISQDYEVTIYNATQRVNRNSWVDLSKLL